MNTAKWTLLNFHGIIFTFINGYNRRFHIIFIPLPVQFSSPLPFPWCAMTLGQPNRWLTANTHTHTRNSKKSACPVDVSAIISNEAQLITWHCGGVNGEWGERGWNGVSECSSECGKARGLGGGTTFGIWIEPTTDETYVRRSVRSNGVQPFSICDMVEE